jgi:hypothetical protein
MTSRQNTKPDGPALRLFAAAALIVASACAAPILATDVVGAGAASDGTQGAPTDAAVRCGVATDSTGAMTTFRPWVRLDRGVPGSYSFALSGGGTMIDQGGSFEVGENGHGLLGEATVSGPASGYDVALTVTVGGTRYRCHGTADDI